MSHHICREYINAVTKTKTDTKISRPLIETIRKKQTKFKRVFYFIGLRESLSLFLIYKLSILYTLLRQVEEAVT